MTAKSIEDLVSASWLAAESAAADLRVFDATVLMTRTDNGVEVTSGRDEWTQGHIPGSGHIDLISELSDPTSSLGFTAPSPTELAAALAARGIGDDTRIVLYDTGFTMWATRVWWLLRSIGFDNAAVLDGGLTAWRQGGHRVSTETAPIHPTATLVARPRPELFADSTAVETAISAGSTCIVNSLSAANHNGTEPGYERPGHIPGAGNVPAMSLVDQETRCYRPLDELRPLFTDSGALAGPTITYCGGGIAATSDAFVLHLLGHDDIAVYDGSLRDWTVRNLPLET